MSELGDVDHCGPYLSEFIRATNANLAVVSSPEHGLPPEKVAIMNTLELAAFHLSPLNFVPAYDFRGSASQMDCKTRVPDCDMGDAGWSDPAKIEASQWCRYWSGRVRGSLHSLLTTSPRLVGNMSIRGKTSNGIASTISLPSGSRHVVAFSVQGGPITQVEFSLLPRLITGVLADLSARDLGSLGKFFLWWVHVDSIDDLIESLQGLRRVDLYDYYCCASRRLGLPMRLADKKGGESSSADLLSQVPGSSHAARAAILLAGQPLMSLDDRLGEAIESNDAPTVRRLLEEGADPNCRPKGELTCTALHLAVRGLNLEIIQTIIDAGADLNATDEDGDLPFHDNNISWEDPMVIERGLKDKIGAIFDAAWNAEG